MQQCGNGADGSDAAGACHDQECVISSSCGGVVDAMRCDAIHGVGVVCSTWTACRLVFWVSPDDLEDPNVRLLLTQSSCVHVHSHGMKTLYLALLSCVMCVFVCLRCVWCARWRYFNMGLGDSLGATHVQSSRGGKWWRINPREGTVLHNCSFYIMAGCIQT